jgi:hypothetical protein
VLHLLLIVPIEGGERAGGGLAGQGGWSRAASASRGWGWRLGTGLTCGAKFSAAGREEGESWASAVERADRGVIKADGLLASWVGRERERGGSAGLG